VVVSNRALLGPALVVSKTSSAMRQMEFMRAMMEEQTKVHIQLFRLASQEWTSEI